MRALLVIILCPVAVALILLATSCRRKESLKTNPAGERLKSILAQGRDYRVYVGVPLDSPTEWRQAEINGQELILSGKRLKIENISAFLVVYPNGQILDAENPFEPFPKGVYAVEEKSTPNRDALNLSRLSEGAAFAQITYGRSASRPHERGYYSTSIQNISKRKIRVAKFAGYGRSGNVYKMSTISGDFFSGDEFISWYGAPQDGWIQPGQTVTDPYNYGIGDGYWVYYCLTEDGKEFAVGAKIPQ